MIFSCECALKASHDWLMREVRGEGLLVVFFKDSFKNEQPFLTVSSIHRLHRFVILGIHQTLHSSPVVPMKSEPLQSCATVRT